MCNDLDLVDDFSGVFQSGEDILSCQLWIAGRDLVDCIPAGDHAQDVPHHDACAADHRLSRANGWIDFDSVHRFHYR